MLAAPRPETQPISTENPAGKAGVQQYVIACAIALPRKAANTGLWRDMRRIIW
jgi:hypothetical protein